MREGKDEGGEEMRERKKYVENSWKREGHKDFFYFFVREFFKMANGDREAMVKCCFKLLFILLLTVSFFIVFYHYCYCHYHVLILPL